MSVLEVKFIGDGDALEHIVDKQEGVPSSSGAVQKMVSFKNQAGRRPKEDAQHDGDENVFLDEQHYIEALGTENAEEDDEGVHRVAGSSIFSFQKSRRGHSMALTASELARTPGKSVSFGSAPDIEPSTPTRKGRNNKGESRTPQKSKKVQFVSTTPHRLRKRITTPSVQDSDSELSPSDSGEDDDEDGLEEEKKEDKENLKTPKKDHLQLSTRPLPRRANRTLERLHTPKLDREMLGQLLGEKPSCCAKEIQQLYSKHRKHFSKWMLQLQLGFSVIEIHLVVNGFFPSITLKSILNALTCEALEHEGSFRTPSDQIQFIAQTLKDSPDLHLYLIIHNIDGPTLRGEKTQSALGQLASLPNLHLVASLDHINAPLVWDQFKQSQFNWLWWECVSFQHYTEETSYENSLLVQQTGALALSSLTHVLRSLTPNARGIFKLLVEFPAGEQRQPFIHRIVIPRFLPALSRVVLGELRPHAQDSADRVQRPQTHSHTQGCRRSGVPDQGD
ncbi:hypothetical protein KUCAC02_018419 [Chaenocephalus aceratus]|uniref:Uncharacterized protein n=1 Tax=Chaenocephalus aceratus TaxID=36190 RepID=A0ACB9W953_CHAAC|nr:hypothetical protein KUCAC02_018419 [Chaenocephalus aceratus]